MKVAFLGIKSLPSTSGADRVVEAIVTRLPIDIEAYVYCDLEYTRADYFTPNVKIIRIKAFPGKYFRPVSLLLASTFHALFWGKYDLIHIHHVESCFVAPLLRLRFKVIATSHGPAYAREKWNSFAKFLIHLMDYFYLWFPNVITSVSFPLTQEYSRFGRTVVYIPNGVDSTPEVDEEASTNALEAAGADHKFLLFVAARMDPTKGCHLLIEAFEKIAPDDIQLVIVGDTTTKPDYGNELLSKANNNIRFVPFTKSKPELMGIIMKSKIFVLPSTIEAMSMTLLEASSLGRPIICSDIPANVSVIGKFALFFRNGDVNDLKEKIIKGLENPEEMDEMGYKGQTWVRDNFSWDAIVTKYYNLYRRTIFTNRSQD